MRGSRSTSTLTHRVRASSGATGAVCSRAHGTIWLDLASPRDAELVADPVTIRSSCAHCVWCGTLVAVPEQCWIHDQGCPRFDVRVTEHARRAIQELKWRYRITGLTPRAWAYFEGAADALHRSGRLDAQQLVARMRDVSIDWAP